MQKKTLPDLKHENRLWKDGYRAIAGVDEVGRGPLAGPVVAAAVILDPENVPTGLNDSKKLGEKEKQRLFEEVMTTSCVAISSLSAKTIDDLNIREASLKAMRTAVHALSIKPDFLLIDGRDLPSDLDIKAEALIGGDGISASIAAASIIAKVTRDRLMEQAAKHYPAFSFESHKGYGSKKHRDAIAVHGPCPLHRWSFKPMREMTIKKGA